MASTRLCNSLMLALSRAEAQMALISQLSNVTLANIVEDALLLRLTTAEATDAGAVH